MAHSHHSSALHSYQLVWHDVSVQARKHAVALKRLGLIGAGSILTFVVLNGLLLTLTYGRVMPFTSINGVRYGFKSTTQAVDLLVAKHATATMVVYNQGQPITLGAAQSGITIRARETLSQGQSGWHRIPLFALVANLFTPREALYAINTQQLAAALAPQVPNFKTDAVEAHVVVPTNLDEEIKITEGVPGSEMSPTIAAQQVAYQANNNTFAVKLVPSPISPRWNKSQVLAILPQLEAARRATVTIQTADQSTSVELRGADLQAMLKINTRDDALGVTLDTALLATYLETKANLFYVAPVATKVGLLDGVEISRSEGVTGRMLDSVKTAESVANTFSQGILIGEAVVSAIEPNNIYTRSYSNSDQGLYKLIEDYATSHSGTYSVGVVELDGTGNRSAFYNADDQMIAASTYKMFVAYAAMLKVESGEWNLSTPTGLGSLDSCMKDMIVVSDNNCPTAILDMLGWSNTDALLKDKGYTGTQMRGFGTGNKMSTARDQIKLLSGLYFGEILQPSSRDYLFGYMKEQIYRSGIPAGSSGSTVADKVGFINDLNHDMGIVYSPNATYALVIFTEGAGGFKNIRDLSKQIYDFYNK